MNDPRLRLLIAAGEGVRIAFATMAANRLRAGLAVLGVGIGVATVMLMAAIIGGMRGELLSVIEQEGPRNFQVMRWSTDKLLLTRDDVFSNPKVTLKEFALVRSLPSVDAASAAVYTPGTLSLGSARAKGPVFGRGDAWPRWEAGDFVEGRNFLPEEMERSAMVVVLSTTTARALGAQAVVGATVRLEGKPFRVVGIYHQEALLGTETPETSVWIPVTTALKHLDMRDDFLWIDVSPRDRVSVQEAIDEVVTALRIARRLRPGAEDDFYVQTNEAAAATFEEWSLGFLVVMLVLSSIGLMVGGVGVVAIMMISVTERTREIGVRRALGATRLGILWQFLVEAVTITLVGGIAGMLVGGAGALFIGVLTPLPAAVPVWAIVSALLVTILGGVGFGLYPAMTAARLAPAVALRYE